MTAITKFSVTEELTADENAVLNGKGSCGALAVKDCARKDCVAWTDCSGVRFCYEKLKGKAPNCGPESYYGQDVPCCPGLEKKCPGYTIGIMPNPRPLQWHDVPACSKLSNIESIGQEGKKLVTDVLEQSFLLVKLPLYSNEKNGQKINEKGWKKEGRDPGGYFKTEVPGSHSCLAESCEDMIQLYEGKPYIADYQFGSGGSAWDDEFCTVTLRYPKSMLENSVGHALQFKLKEIGGHRDSNPSGNFSDRFGADLLGPDGKKMGKLSCNLNDGEDESSNEKFRTSFADVERMVRNDRIELRLIPRTR